MPRIVKLVKLLHPAVIGNWLLFTVTVALQKDWCRELFVVVY